MTPKGHAIPSKTQLLSYGTPAFWGALFVLRLDGDIKIRYHEWDAKKQ